MTKTFYFTVENENGTYILVDGDKRYKCPELSTFDEKVRGAVTYIATKGKGERALRLVIDNNTWTGGTAQIKKLGTGNAVTDELELATTVNVETSNMSDEQKDLVTFIHKNSVGLKPADLKLDDLKWKYLLHSVKKAKNIMMTGPSGCGKTFAVQCISKVFPEMPYFFFNLGATQDPRSTLIGNTHFKKDEGTYFAQSEFVKAIQTPNAIVHMDELTRAHPEAFNILMTVLDPSQRYLRLDEADDSPTVKVAEGVCFLATANIGAEYTSTRVLDRAIIDRFKIIEMNTLTKADEIHLLGMRFPTLSKRKVEAIADIAIATREEIKSDAPKISTIISTRGTLEMAELMDDGFKLEEAAEVTLYPLFDEAGGIDSERTWITQVVQKHITVNEEDIFNTDGGGTDDTSTSGDINSKKPF